MTDKAKILLVDDEPGMLRYIKTLLEVEDHQVATASTGEEALEIVEKGMSPDLVLLDLLMPGIDGLELVARIRKTHPKMPVAVVSANVQDEIIGRARELNAAFVTKPLTDEALGAFLSGAVLRLKKAAQ